jgi:YD repeat-containing protein
LLAWSRKPVSNGEHAVASKLASKIDSRNVFLLLLFVFSFLNLIPFSVVAVADTAQYYYDPDGRLVGVVDSLNGSAQYSYDATGNILSVATSPATAVSVVGYNPPTAIAGAVITIGGTGYDTAADTTVNFNGTPATPSAVTATTITVAVPAGATTGPVTVTAPAGTGASTASFIVASPYPGKAGSSNVLGFPLGLR